MNKILDVLSRGMTREEFIKNNVYRCPHKLNLQDQREISCTAADCFQCWRKAVKDIPFKDDMQMPDLEREAEKTVFGTGAWRNNKDGKGRYDLIPWTAIHELAKHCQDGAIAHGERNVDKGIPIHDLLDSALRHLSQYMQGKTDEIHLRSAFWNIAWAVEFEVTKPELQDIPSRMDKPNEI